MPHPPPKTLRIGDWLANPMSGELSRGEERVRLEARTMRLLLCLAERPGEVVSIDTLLSQVWSGVVVTPDSVYQAVAGLRRLLGDDAKQPAYIVTVPRLGYRLVAPVETQVDTPAVPSTARAKSRMYAAIAAAVVLGVGSLTYYFVSARETPDPTTVAVLPFLDLTDSMNEEPFADGMTEELIHKLSQVPGLRVPAPTASFYFKGKQLPLPEIAKSLRVAYVLDGSVRKSGETLRVAARLVRADDGYVVWSENYDRPLDDKLRVQDDIAGEVTSALRKSID
ncbi:MAG TPA: winged helix-turn-helix domain-containing protein [Steroidobacteraceae bacterium]|jgi:transcriptional activator of cad operon|nr:winged helix-turn-helix domain-containing protein [Steroidobacteraceae bacterium]